MIYLCGLPVSVYLNEEFLEEGSSVAVGVAGAVGVNQLPGQHLQEEAEGRGELAAPIGTLRFAA